MRAWQLLLVYLLIVSQEAYAYFDPGTGSMLIQVLIALFGGIILFFKQISFTAKNFLAKYNIVIANKFKNMVESQISNKPCLLAAVI